MRPGVAYQCRSHEKSVLVKLLTRMVAVVMQAPLNRIAVANEVLPKEVCYEDVLVPSVKAVQTAVGVLFEHREEGAVVLVAVIADRKSHTSELQSQSNLVCRLLLEKKNN